MLFRILLVVLYSISLYAANHSVNIGVLSFRPLEENQKVWQPLVDDLKQKAPQYDFNITSHNQIQLSKLVDAGVLHFAIVHPQLNVEMETRFSTVNIASVVRKSLNSELHLNKYGGVIAILSGTEGIKTLTDIKGKKIATTHEDAFAAMLLQRDTMQKAGVDITKDCKMIYTGQPLDNVLQALRNKEADVGFFRTGYIEEMIENGKLKPDELVVLNRQSNPDFPYLHSTPLYPEWAVVATKIADNQMVKDITTALYAIESNTTSDYHGFDAPQSYKSTRELMEKYDIYPFSHVFDLNDVVKKYSPFLVALSILILAISGFLANYYFRLMKKSDEEKKQIENILATASDGIHILKPDGSLVMFSDSFAQMLGYSKKEIATMSVSDWDKHFTKNTIEIMFEQMRGKQKIFHTRHTKKDGSLIDVEIYAKGIETDKGHFIYADPVTLFSTLNPTL